MAKRGLKLFGMGVGTLVVLAAIIVGILFATGVIKPKQDEDKPDTTDPTDPSGQSTDLSGPGTATVSNVTIIEGTCHGNDPCTAAGISYDISSTCKDYAGCSIVVKHKFLYADGSQNELTKTYKGSGGRQSHMFSKSWFGQTRIPIGVELTAHSVVHGVSGKESTIVTIRIPS